MYLVMSSYSLIILLAICGSAYSNPNTPPHCTTLTKESDYTSTFKLDYTLAYIQSGQREGYQQLYCVNPPEVKKAHTVVCDWAAPPQVQFTLGDEHVRVVRMDPTGKYLGYASMATYQLCGHNMTTTVPVAPITSTTTEANFCWVSDHP